jgi:hypothetical protein
MHAYLVSTLQQKNWSGAAASCSHKLRNYVVARPCSWPSVLYSACCSSTWSDPKTKQSLDKPKSLLEVFLLENFTTASYNKLPLLLCTWFDRSDTKMRISVGFLSSMQICYLWNKPAFIRVLELVAWVILAELCLFFFFFFFFFVCKQAACSWCSEHLQLCLECDPAKIFLTSKFELLRLLSVFFLQPHPEN